MPLAVQAHAPPAATLEGDARVARRREGQGARAQAPRLADSLFLRRRCGCGAAGSQAGAGSLADDAHAPSTEPLPPGVAHVLRSPGEPLAADVREPLEAGFGSDFAHVRVHTGAAASATASALRAHAYTVGHHIVLGAPPPARSDAERRLLAHELAHVLQQDAAPAGPPVVGRPDDPAEAEAEHRAEAALASMAATRADGAPRAQTPPMRHRRAGHAQRLLMVDRAQERPDYGPPALRRVSRAELVQGWLRRLCPEAQPSVATSGEVTLGADDVCARAERTLAAQEEAETRLTRGFPLVETTTPVSCSCLCRAVRGERRIDLQVDRLIRAAAADPGNPPDRRVEGSGGGATLMPDNSEFEVERPTVVVSGLGRRIPGADPQTPGLRRVSDPPWLILAHELCGHVLHDPAHEEHDAAARFSFSHGQTEEGRRSTVDVENLIRGEHGLGTRRGDAALYRLRDGDDLAALEHRFGVVARGARAWRLDAGRGVYVHRALDLAGSEFPEASPEMVRDGRAESMAEQALAEARARGAEVAVFGAAWDTVHERDTWQRIALRWGVRPRGGRTAAERVRDANDGVRLLLLPGARVLIPVP